MKTPALRSSRAPPDIWTCTQFRTRIFLGILGIFRTLATLRIIMTIPLRLSLPLVLTPPMLVITWGPKLIHLKTNSSLLRPVSLSQKLISACSREI